MPNTERELVLSIGFEGEGMDFFRQWDGEAAWQFSRLMTSAFSASDLPDFGIETRDRGTVRPKRATFPTLEDAILDCSARHEWVCADVSNVHPDYREYVWELRERTLTMMGPRLRAAAERHNERWARHCGRRLPRERSGKMKNSNPIVIRPGSTLDAVLGASIAIFEHLQNRPMTAEEIQKFEARTLRVMEDRQQARRATVSSTDALRRVKNGKTVDNAAITADASDQKKRTTVQPDE